MFRPRKAYNSGMNVYEQISAFYGNYRGEKTVFGKSVEGRDLYAFHIGSSSGAQILSQYAIHAREWVTALLSLYHIRRGLPKGGAWVIPLMNPDGAVLCQAGEKPQERLVSLNGGEDFSLWKANARAVDLNVNFDARWGTGASNLKRPAPANYIGVCPHSEPEVRALVSFTLQIRPAATVSWHTKGEEIYWEFHQSRKQRRRDRALAAVLAESTGYPLVTVKNSAGGYKDWCIEKLKIPAFTVEVGSDALSHPLGKTALPEIVGRTLDALVDLGGAL